MTSYPLIQKIKLKYRTAIDVIVSIMIFALEDSAVRKILAVLFGYLMLVVGVYILYVVWYMIHPSTQMFVNITMVLILYFVVAGITILVIVLYGYSKRSTSVKIDKDDENLERLKLLINEEIDESISKEKK